MFLLGLAADADQNRRLASAMGRLEKVLGKGGDCHHSVGFRPQLSPRGYCANASRMPKDASNPGLTAEGAVPWAQPPGQVWLQHLSQFHSRQDETWQGSVKRRWAAATCGQQHLEWWAGLALADPGSRRAIGRMGHSSARAKAALFVGHQRPEQRRHR